MLHDIVHFLHLLSGVIWAGGTIVFAVVVEPAVLRLGPAVTRDFLEKSQQYAGPVMGGSGGLLFLTGIGQVFLGGGVSSFGDLTEPYGLLALAALAIVLVVTILGGRHRANLQRMVENASETTAEMRSAQRQQAAVAGVGIFVTIAIMTILGLGLY